MDPIVNIQNGIKKPMAPFFCLLPSTLEFNSVRAPLAPAFFSFAPDETAPRDETRQSEMSGDGQRTSNEHGAARCVFAALQSRLKRKCGCGAGRWASSRPFAAFVTSLSLLSGHGVSKKRRGRGGNLGNASFVSEGNGWLKHRGGHKNKKYKGQSKWGGGSGGVGSQQQQAKALQPGKALF